MRRFLPLILLSLAFTTPAWAGNDCEPEQGWSLLRKLAKGKVSAKQLGDGNNDVDLCLLGPRAISGWQDSWHRKPQSKRWSWKTVGGTKPHADSDKILAACTPAFASEGRDIARSLCLPLLAWWGVKEVAGRSLLAWGEDTYDCGFPLMFLPDVGGEAAARKAESRWEPGTSTHCGYGGCSCEEVPEARKSKRSKRLRKKFVRKHKLNVLNVLSYAGDSKSLEFIRTHALVDPDKKVVERGQKVIQSIEDILANPAAK